jgi:hypothetical protein
MRRILAAMNNIELAKRRLTSQQIGGTRFNNPKNVLEWMGALQAQDFAMAKWAVGTRLPLSTECDINRALDQGDILRTHLLRPTWHLVSNADIYWMLELTAPQIRGSFNSRHIQLGLTNTILKKSNSVIEKTLRGGTHLTREELIKELDKVKIVTDGNRASHLFAWAELEGIICSGTTKGGKPTYALLEERVPKKITIRRDDALATLAKKYFTSRCPATFQDFVWWSGLNVRDARHALEMISQEFIPEKIDSETFWLTPGFSAQTASHGNVFLLPAFDEFIISYKDRSAALPFKNHKKTISSNGIFRPVIVVNGQVSGIWKRTIGAGSVEVTAELFESPSKEIRDQIGEASEEYGRYLEKEITLNFIS